MVSFTRQNQSLDEQNLIFKSLFLDRDNFLGSAFQIPFKISLAVAKVAELKVKLLKIQPSND